MIIGAFLIVVGTIINGTTLYNPGDTSQLQGGRFVLGFGVSIISAAGPIYVVETSHPAWRSVITAYCNTFWFTGSILSSGAVRGAIVLKGNISWQIPVWLQLFFPGLILLFVWFIPESPRWLFVNNKREQSRAVLAKWHGNGNNESAWVTLQIAEYEEYLNTNGADKRWWDYRALFGSRSGRYRLMCNCLFSIFGQWSGNGALTYYLPAVLLTIGITDSIKQANVNLGYACFQFFFALAGAAFVERIGRRKLMLGSMASVTVTWIAMTAAAGTFNNTGETDQNAANAMLAFIFIFGACFSFGITPLQALYPVEVLSFEQRAKGMAFSALCVNAAGLLNAYAWPIALEKIGWHTYIIFLLWCSIQFTVFYFFFPETRRRTLEELDKIFNSPNPVKTSLVPHKIAVDSEGTIVASEDI
ncbi:hypothetical protein LTR37_021490 [Vermiconidia calcicola]|uniref:Uncharacterized protein n=1 Tax=Vermiconidia calcicola TaxID=1690605 RepID=A0ACC3MAB6_9PEZI|nr:hypothetical protein LTR37_021490 [Vermiconidia calcicola]